MSLVILLEIIKTTPGDNPPVIITPGAMLDEQGLEMLDEENLIMLEG